jgi:hypothetical protein
MYLDPAQRVPFFFFEDRELGINEEATKENGYDVAKIVTFIKIVPHGHKGDPLEFIADDFLIRKAEDVRAGRYDPQWVQEFKTGLALYREGKEIPRHGTPLITWERTTKARREELAKQFPTVEDLAAVPDSGLGNIGLDGRVLRDLAKGDIQAKKDLSPVVKELAEAKEDNRRLQEQIDTLTEQFNRLEREQKTITLKKSA